MKSKRLVVSCKTMDQVLGDFKTAARSVQKGVAAKTPQYEVSFDNRADFNRFVRNIPILSAILIHKPHSIYELAKITKLDVSNLNKIIQFFEDVGVVTVSITTSSGRTVREPRVEYDEVVFRLAV